MTPDLSTTVGPVRFKNPVLLASGTCGYGAELNDLLDLNAIGGIVVKGISLEPRSGNPPPRIAETPCGLLNAIGLENVGIEEFLRVKLPWLRRVETVVIVNILGNSEHDYAAMAGMLDGADGVDAIEVNISCPNVKQGGVAFGTDPDAAARITEMVRAASKLPVIVKLTPNVTNIAAIARAVEAAGADAVSLVNTVLGMKIDVFRKAPSLANIFGGLSGPAIKPIALRMVWQVARAVKIPVIGMGGISTWQDAVEFMMAGACAVQVGTATLVKPSSSAEIISGIREFMQQQNIDNIKQFKIRL